MPDSRRASHVSEAPHGASNRDLNESKSQEALSRRGSSTLPSFATLQHYATSRPNNAAPPSTRSLSSTQHPCSTCDQVLPLIKDVAAAAMYLHEAAQVFCARTASEQAPECPTTSPTQTLQWVHDRLVAARADVRSAAPGHAMQPHTPGPPNRHLINSRSRGGSPLNLPFKRSTDYDEGFARPTAKKPRNDSHSDTYVRRRSSVLSQHTEAVQNQGPTTRGLFQRALSPPLPTDSAPGSAHPGHQSPAPLSLAPPTVDSMGSPTASYRAPSTIHTTSTSSATSAHIAELQHQVTLKSLSLQSLQSEYSSMLQKLQREKIKSQAIEKKTTVADNEVNELTIKNEDLTEQVKDLETQLEETAKKRDAERTAAAKEKDQWSRMLEMSGRLHSKCVADKEKLAEERATLERRLLILQGEKSNTSSSASDADVAVKENGNWQPYSQSSAHSTQPLQASAGPHHTEERLKRDNASLRNTIEGLRFALMTLRQDSQEFHESLQRIQSHGKKFEDVIAQALESDKVHVTATNPATDSATKPREKQIAAPAIQGDSALLITNSAARTRPAKRPSQLSQPPSPQHALPELDLSPTAVAAAARAHTPESTELGFDVQTTTKSPEELMRALGPVPISTSANKHLSTSPQTARTSGKKDQSVEAAKSQGIERNRPNIDSASGRSLNSAWTSVNKGPQTMIALIDQQTKRPNLTRAPPAPSSISTTSQHTAFPANAPKPNATPTPSATKSTPNATTPMAATTSTASASFNPPTKPQTDFPNFRPETSWQQAPQFFCTKNPYSPSQLQTSTRPRNSADEGGKWSLPPLRESKSTVESETEPERKGTRFE
ncbi:hypothetical protein MBLNU230_g2372t1 [Neophaeotheca triangularis]